VILASFFSGPRVMTHDGCVQIPSASVGLALVDGGDGKFFIHTAGSLRDASSTEKRELHVQSLSECVEPPPFRPDY
jgi:hypothetical protein